MPLDWIWTYLRRFAALFEARTYPGARVTPVHVWLLAAIIAIGAALRLWELGAVGLHGDEKTNALPTMHIVEHGTPYLPSGMFYPRALGQLYLMAGSVRLFGESEWALRLPSALCGVLLIFLAYLVGKRFLAPTWNVAFTAAVAFLPAFIIDAQTARMYVFLIASLAAMLILIFRWERTGRTGALIAAVIASLIALQFQSLAVFSTFMFFFPGLLHGDRRRLLQGFAAFAVGFAAFAVNESWIGSHYPPKTDLEDAGMVSGPRAAWALPEMTAPLLVASAGAALFLGFLVARRIPRTRAAWAAGLLVAAGVCAQLMFFHHVGLLLLVAAGVVALRHGQRALPPLVVVAIMSAAIAAAHVFLLRSNGVESLRQTFGAMLGQPSLWPYLVTANYSIAAGIAAAGAVAVTLVLLARRRRIPDFMLTFALAVWLPLLAIGVFTWDLPPRYTAGQILPLILVACAAAQWCVTTWLAGRSMAAPRAAGLQAGAAVLLAVFFVNPVSLARTAGAGYAVHPDHKGAANFIRSQHLAPDDIVLAEDVLQQTYYLGKVDYWLIAPYVATRYTQEVGGELHDIYTAAPVITSGEELEALISRTDRGAIYVIGSGEEQEDGRRHARGPEIFALLQPPRFEVVYEGRDGLTKVWKLPRPQPTQGAALEAKAAPGWRFPTP